jgi:outer membrane immunogenic protein
MRWVISALFVLAFAPPALADDFDVLRGSQVPVGPATFTRWSGFYAGGQLSYGDAETDFSRATQPLLAFSLRELVLESQQHPSQWPVLGKADDHTTGFGGFVGYNSQWQDLIIGIEGNYTHTNFVTTAANSPISRVVSAGGNAYSVTVTGTGMLDLTDYASLRARAGYVLGNFLPYGFVGFVVGRANYAVTTEVFGQQNSASPFNLPCDPTLPTCVNYDFTNSTAGNGATLYGGSVGIGLDWALTPNLFLRGEFEYILFSPIANIDVSIINARVGAGVKF